MEPLFVDGPMQARIQENALELAGYLMQAIQYGKFRGQVLVSLPGEPVSYLSTEEYLARPLAKCGIFMDTRALAYSKLWLSRQPKAKKENPGIELLKIFNTGVKPETAEPTE